MKSKTNYKLYRFKHNERVSYQVIPTEFYIKQLIRDAQHLFCEQGKFLIKGYSGYNYNQLDYMPSEHELWVESVLGTPIGNDVNLHKLPIFQDEIDDFTLPDMKNGHATFERTMIRCLIITPINGNDILGAIQFSNDCKTGTGMIEKLAVDPFFRKQGLGSVLLQTALKILTASGVECIQLTSLHESTAFYKKHGFICRSFDEPKGFEILSHNPLDILSFNTKDKECLRMFSSQRKSHSINDLEECIKNAKSSILPIFRKDYKKSSRRKMKKAHSML